MLSRPARWLVACGLWLPLAALAAGSIPLAVAPVIVKMDMATEFAAVEVNNRGEQATGIEVEILRVRWVEGREQYEPTTDFVVSPPAFRLAASKGRMVRFRYTAPRQDTEGFYRLFIRQLPEEIPGNQISMVFNLGVPVFVAPTASRPQLVIAGPSGTNGQAALRNTGNVTLNLLQLEGQNCPEGSQKLLTRLSPDQQLALKASLSQCATGVQTDRGLIPLTAAARP